MDHDMDGNGRVIRVDYRLVLGTSFYARIPAGIPDERIGEYLEEHDEAWCRQLDTANLDDTGEGRLDITPLGPNEQAPAGTDPIPIGTGSASRDGER